VFNVTPNGGRGGIWQAGGGPATDVNGNIYVMTGNGTFDTNVAYRVFGDGFSEVITGQRLAIDGLFHTIQSGRAGQPGSGFGSGGPLVLPDEVGGITSNQHLLVGAGKNGTMYLIDRDSMAHFNPAGDTQIVQSFRAPSARALALLHISTKRFITSALATP